jgi:hypothetical protein
VRDASAGDQSALAVSRSTTCVDPSVPYEFAAIVYLDDTQSISAFTYVIYVDPVAMDSQRETNLLTPQAGGEDHHVRRAETLLQYIKLLSHFKLKRSLHSFPSGDIFVLLLVPTFAPHPKMKLYHTQG